MSATAFQRRRREIARLRAEATNVLPDQKDQAAGQDDPQNDELIDDQLGKPINADDIEDIEQVKAMLDELNIKYAHNTGEDKLREKLKDAIG